MKHEKNKAVDYEKELVFAIGFLDIHRASPAELRWLAKCATALANDRDR